MPSRTPAAGPLAGLPLLEDLPELDGRRVLVRVDFNVPIGHLPSGEPFVSDDFRIRSALPTLTWLLERGAAVTACSHLGRPKGRVDPRYDVAPVRTRLDELVPGVALLDNLRFDPGEEGNDPAFVDRLVEGFSAYVNDAFGSSHRAHASVVGPPARLPSAAGRLLAREVEVLGGLLVAPARPFVAVVGGAKVADKLGVLGPCSPGWTRWWWAGAWPSPSSPPRDIGWGRRSSTPATSRTAGRCSRSPAAAYCCRATWWRSPPAARWARTPPGGARRTSSGWRSPTGGAASTSGPRARGSSPTSSRRRGRCSGTGPWGLRGRPLRGGDGALATAMAATRAFTVVGGGDTVAALDHMSLGNDIDYVSTGGGASLELLEHGDLPGLEALRHASNAPAVSEWPRRTAHRRPLVSGNWKMTMTTCSRSVRCRTSGCA